LRGKECRVSEGQRPVDEQRQKRTRELQEQLFGGERRRHLAFTKRLGGALIIVCVAALGFLVLDRGFWKRLWKGSGCVWCTRGSCSDERLHLFSFSRAVTAGLRGNGSSVSAWVRA